MHNKANEQLLQDMYAAWRRKSPQDVSAFFTDDCIYEDMAMNVLFNGKEEVAGFATEVYQTMPNFNVEYTKLFATDTHAAGQWVISANWDGEFEGVDCTGKAVEFTGLSYYEFAEGKISRAQDCWDYTSMMAQFGVLRESLRHLT